MKLTITMMLFTVARQPMICTWFLFNQDLSKSRTVLLKNNVKNDCLKINKITVF